MPYFTGREDSYLHHKVKEMSIPTEMKMMDMHGDGKHPVMELHELIPGLEFKVPNQDGQGLDKKFHAMVTVEGIEFKGVAANRKAAKFIAASSALQHLKFSGVYQMLVKKKEEAKSDKAARTREFLAGRSDIIQKRTQEYKINQSPSFLHLKNALVKLNDRVRGVSFETLREGSTFEPDSFEVTVTVEGATYVGIGKTKKLAKLDASEKALKAMGVWNNEDEKAKELYTQDKERKVQRASQYRGSFDQSGGGQGYPGKKDTRPGWHKHQSSQVYGYESKAWHGQTPRPSRGQRGRGRSPRGRGRGHGRGIDYSRTYEQFVHGGSCGSADFMGIDTGHGKDSKTPTVNTTEAGDATSDQLASTSSSQSPAVGKHMAELAGFGLPESFPWSQPRQGKGSQEIPF